MQTLMKQEERDTTVISLTAPTFAQAKEIVKGRVFRMKDYQDFRKNYPHYNLPSSPRVYYKGEFISVYDFLGTQPATIREKAIAEHWEKVHKGEIERKPYQSKKKTVDETETVEQEQPVDDRIQLINLMRKYEILDLCADGLKSLFTYEELFKMVIK